MPSKAGLAVVYFSLRSFYQSPCILAPSFGGLTTLPSPGKPSACKTLEVLEDASPLQHILEAEDCDSGNVTEYLRGYGC